MARDKSAHRKRETNSTDARGKRNIPARLQGLAPALIPLLGISILVTAGAIAGRPAARKSSESMALAPQGTGPGNPSKEYVYAGSRLIATEEPTVPGPSAPTKLAASATSASAISLTWTASQGAVNHYFVKRSSNASGFQTVAYNVAATNYLDSGLAPNTTYVYAVLAAADAAGTNLSSPSNVDYATTVVFADQALVQNVTTVKAQHVIELRTAVNAVRSAAGLGAYAWTHANLTQGVTVVTTEDIAELRTAVNLARKSLNLPPWVFTDLTLSKQVSVIKAGHIIDLRHAAKGVGY